MKYVTIVILSEKKCLRHTVNVCYIVLPKKSDIA